RPNALMTVSIRRRLRCACWTARAAESPTRLNSSACRWYSRAGGRTTMADLPQRLVAVVAADVAGYTRLMELDEPGTVQSWRRARAEAIDPIVALHRGRIVKLTGDGFLAEFPTVENAVRAALEMQETLARLFASAPPTARL